MLSHGHKTLFSLHYYSARLTPCTFQQVSGGNLFSGPVISSIVEHHCVFFFLSEHDHFALTASADPVTT